jgi:hypothetical protein
MPNAIEASIREMVQDARTQVVGALAKKYGFDQEEAVRFLVNSELKIVRKRGPSPKTTDKKATKAAAKEDKPKRAKTGYLLYADEVRAEVRAELEAELEDGQKLAATEVVKAIAARWKDEDKETQEEYKARAKELASGSNTSAEASEADE